MSGVTQKRKPSNLRNAFSPDAEDAGSPRFSRSPSVDSIATTSVINGAGGGGKKKRRKGGDTGDGASVAGSSLRGGKVRGDGGEAEGDYEEGEDEDEDDMGEEMDTAIEGGMSVEARRKQEKDHERYFLCKLETHPD